MITDRAVVRDIAEALAAWRTAGRPFAVATVVRTWQSAPRPPGAAMAVAADGEVIGSVSGGCVEAAVHAAALEVISSGKTQLQRYGVSDGDAFAAGLTCGGTIEVLIQPGTALQDVLDDVRAGRPVATVSLLSTGAQLALVPTPAPGATPTPDSLTAGSRVVGSLGDAGLDRLAVLQAAGMLAAGSSGVVRTGNELTFVQSYAPPPRMIVFGAIDFAGAVARIGVFLGYHVTVCDARPVFATRSRFPMADELVVDWPHRYLASAAVDERTVLCVLTHDPKFDVPLLEVALRTPARYIGVMGNRRTHTDRLARLREAGVPAASLERLSAPIGLDLGARTPEETAVAIAAEIIALEWGGTGRRLSDLTAPIHG